MKKILLIALILLLCASAQAAVCVRLEETAALLQRDGAVIVPPDVYEDIVSLGGDRFAARRDGAWALMNEEGKLLTSAIYSDLRPAGDLLLACRDEKWGLLRPDGTEITAFAYTRILWNGSDGFWALKTNPVDGDSDVLYLLSCEGTETETGLTLRRMGGAGEGLLAVQLPGDGLWGYCDSRGDLVIPAQYSHAGAFRSGCAAVTLNDGFGAVNRSGEMIVPAQYDALEITSAGAILASAAGEGVKVFSPEGNEIAAYAGSESFAAAVGDGYAVYGGETRIFSAEGEQMHTASGRASVSEGLNGDLIIADGAWGESCAAIAGTENYHQHIYPLGMDGDEALYACMRVNASRYMNDLLGEEQLAVDMDSARYGVTDGQGNILLPAEYESVAYLGEGRLLVQSGGLWQMNDTAGRVYWEYGSMQSEEPSF